MALTSVEKLGEAFSLALETRTPGYQDLVSNSNAIWHAMKQRGMWKTFSGPTIRVRLVYAESGTYVRYQHADFLNPQRKELVNDAEFTPKLGAISVVMTNHEILQTNGRNELKNRMMTHIEAGEKELKDRFVEDLHSAGATDNQIGGLQKAIPTTVNSGVYGGIDRSASAAAVWRTKSYDSTGAPITDLTDKNGDAIAAFNGDTAQQILTYVAIQTSRGQQGPTMWAMAAEHFMDYATATEAIQRVTNDNTKGGVGFTSLKHYGGGRSIDAVLEGGIGSAMPSSVTYGIDASGMSFRYHPGRNFTKFGGRLMPVNQDMIIQHIGFMGELCLENPLHMSKIY